MKNYICILLGAVALVGCSRDHHSAMNASDSQSYSSMNNANEAAGSQNSSTQSSNGNYDNSATGNPTGKSGTGTAVQGTK
ncbi:MAG: hypothetical protein JWN25_3273 [Verrucomicrobiales bacterium]|jgi:uncharacterized protein YcfL|nr:hypothetical protein [Verrucomicrobiales bacterium]MDB6131128.1 hypothetical protein [Verrucomicrobiales bacterium]